MENQPMTTGKALMVLGLLGFLILLAVIVPVRFGVKTYRDPIVFLDPTELSALSEDRDQNNAPDWQDLLTNSISTSTKRVISTITVTDEEKRRLEDPNNLTASFSKNIYTATAYAKQNGSLTSAQQEEMVASLLDKEAEKIQVKTYEITDLRVVASNDETKAAYGKAFALILEKAAKYKLDASDIDLIEAYTINKDPAPLASLVIKKNNIALIINDLLATPVPRSAVPYHLLLINQLSIYKTTVENLSQADTDPIRATLSYNEYASVGRALVSALEALQNYFILENISLGTTKP